MSCELGIYGIDFNVDEFVKNSGIAGFRKGYKGELRSGSKTEKNEFSYAKITISNADFSDVRTQIKEAEEFLLKYKNNLKKIADNEVIEAGIDFGANDFMENGMVKSFYFPPTLVAICAELKLSIELSVYSA
jgi:hypothetical protein